MPTNSTRAMTLPNGRLATRSERLRQQIKTGVAVKYLNDVVAGTEEANAVRVNAAKFLIQKTIPDLPAIKVETDPLAGAKDITHADVRSLLRVIEGEAERTG